MNSFLKKFVIGEWNIGISNENFLKEFAQVQDGGTLVLKITWMKHRKGCSFFADPFIYAVEPAKAYILAEEYNFPRKKGIISMCCIDRSNGNLLSLKSVLEEECHLSYPFYDKEAESMIPESCRLNRWCSYSEVAEKMKLTKELAPLPLIDATPVTWNGEEYVFGSFLPNALSELYVYHVGKDGELTPMPGNPQKTDIATARCGGKFFEYDGRLFRIAQDSTNRYGEAIHIMEITKLTPTEFAEKHYCNVELCSDGTFPLGCHTLNFEADFIVVDGYRERFRPWLAIYMHKIAPQLHKLKLVK